MEWDSEYKPRLRPLEAVPLPEEDDGYIALRDTSGLSDVVLTASQAALFVLGRMDGTATCNAIRGEFEREAGHSLSKEDFVVLLNRLEECRFLEGPTFEQFFQTCQDDYCEQGVRISGDESALSILGGSSAMLDDMVAEIAPDDAKESVAGLVAPHLDYPRGSTCYAHAYSALRRRATPDRVIILGTNHFGRSSSVVATSADFETPLGRVNVDRSFLERVESRCGSLRQYELDHLREHSIELQVAWLQHVFGSDSFSIVPFLCPDPCGPTGTAPYDNHGVDLRVFAETIGELMTDVDTLVVAGADLSHVGAQFGDQRELDDTYLKEVESHDRRVLDELVNGGAVAMADYLGELGNPTSICSAGCVYALATAVSPASGSLLHYHQAVDQPSQTCVTCSAIVYSE